MGCIYSVFSHFDFGKSLARSATGAKAGVELSLLRPLEQLKKIERGKRHFKQLEQVHFRVVKAWTT
jgi:hypothetical protein